ALQLFGQLFRDVIVQRMHQRLPPISAGRARLRLLPRDFTPATGALTKLASAALTAGEVRSPTSWESSSAGSSRDDSPAPRSTKKKRSTPCAIARSRLF